ncbi:diguanylate cyclase [Jatrophihabitans sp. DSM 45814]
MAVPSSSDVELEKARSKFLYVVRLTALCAFLAVAGLAYIADSLASKITGSDSLQHLATAGIVALASAPVVIIALRLVFNQVSSADAVADARQSRLDEEGRHRDLEAKVSDALEMADSEQEALRVIERSFATVLPHQPVELLLADNSHAHLTLRAFTAPDGAKAGCTVASPQECPAARRARVHHFPDSDAVNACPKLADRDQGRCSALCIPVAVMGRTVGVIHSVQELGATVEDGAIEDLQSIANQAGHRLGMLRIMAETQMQASTDGLTGLLNRRAFENGFLGLRSSSRNAPAVFTMADLDNFKKINDTYGHETGDRALRVFAETLRSVLREKDLFSRRGGEEFAVIFPDCDMASALGALDRVRTELQTAIQLAGLPVFTASFGVVPAKLEDDLDALLARADAALFEAKRNGRNRVVVHDSAGTAEASFGSSLPEQPSQQQGGHAVSVKESTAA